VGSRDVLIDVAYCGICHSDLSLIDGVFPPQKDVVIQGHEASGVITKLGPGVRGWSVGDRVIPAAGRPCGDCAECRRAKFTECLRTQLMAFAYDGAWAEFHVAQAAGLTRVPDNVSLQQAALLADAVSTPFGAVVRTGKVGIGEAVGVWGVGGVGTHVVQLARLVGAAPIIAFDLIEEVRERAIELGADYAFDPNEEGLRDTIRDLTGGRGLDVAFDVVGIQSTFTQARKSLRTGGRLVAVGMSNGKIEIGTTAAFGLSRAQLLGHLGYQNEDIGTLASLLSRGRLDLSRSVSAILPLEEVQEGIRRLHEHDGNPIRILIQPGKGE
ncbi:MAG: zinc-binding dehydrogenase, partial [Solirubrobacteraceae bacterium]|nr:zinc-binding dehydrogenase [Solirubrobacteraceae bacterium]